ncbi:peptide ABC transporter substrate-binding protein [Apilactobacillus micheneri]|uniref:Peptide ABC transporter substrate-binding protein n=1 Tax=Apilactobacillus micheneri TaxID=1899430 RepID=A0ABY2YX16_9LACO|nr:peptide ABC transporter substrate-binding protein [Apilactobacillus micheneri]TPR24674.1 peptide ABC transporter substrate-binding protein [Apilactobacillus micheneri]TPR25985.1 peptide ABC transporter substrate-binding protein [Apilactobacillus micheneri]TPR28175.1 peptide ABC transporter substrate-binding protein [Apilactobacillus micheneri]TPR29666.1 peptide ABC transporter substrate-binding protein [Apilactobacillus micheneri]TPR30452.1 peptide ABC transporter substrate-binding protein 
MKIKSAIMAGAVSVSSLCLLSACGNKQQSSSKLVQWQQPTNLTTLDASKATDNVSFGTLNNSNEGLLMAAKNNTVKPGVAKSYQVSPDGKTYTFNLRHSKWSNGKPVTANNFVYAWQRTVNPKTASQYSYLFDHIKNASQIGENKASLSSLGVKADGNYKLIVSLTKPQSYFKYLVAMAPFYPQSKETVNKYGQSYGTNSDDMLYNGPFKVTGWTGTNDSWKLIKNNNYWNAKNIKFNGVKFNVQKDSNTDLNQYSTGALDLTNLVGKQQVGEFKHSKELHNVDMAAPFYIEMNQKNNSVFKNINIRKAISLAIDRDQFTKSTLGDGSKPAQGYVSPGMPKHNGKTFIQDAGTKTGVSYNLNDAKKLWNKGLKEIGKSSVNISLLADDTDNGKSTTEFLQTSLEKLPGLNVSSQNVPSKSKLTRAQSGDFDMVINSWVADFPDPISFLSLFTSNGTYNNGKWSNAKYDSLINKAEGTDANNSNKRWNDLVNAEKTLMSEQGIIPIYYQVRPIAIKPRISGVQFFPTGSPYDLRNIRINNNQH